MPWQKVADIADLDESYPTARTVAGVPIALYLVDGQVCASSNHCTHGQALLSDGYQEDGVIECPLHQGRFDIRTGRALCLPLTTDLKVFSAEARSDGVWVLLD